MRRGRAWAAAAVGLSLVVAVLSACSIGQGASTEDERAAYEPVTIKRIQGTQLDRITMTRRAAERIDVRTARVVSAGGRSIVLAGAVLFEPDGETFLYTSPEPLAFVRQSVDVDHYEGDIAILSSGPRPGTSVVTLGAAELYGAESGLGSGEEEEE